MNFILKIVEGPNRGAEIALVEGVAVTLGKGEDCDIVLADPTMPDEPLSIEARADGVVAGGKPLEPLHVTTLGATSIAVGPADTPWGALVWPSAEKPGAPASDEADGAGGKPEDGGDEPAGAPPAPREGEEPPPARRRHGCLGCLVMLALVFLALAALFWFFRDNDAIRPYADQARPYALKAQSYANGLWIRLKLYCQGGDAGAGTASQDPGARRRTLESVVGRYGLELVDDEGQAKVTGNLKTRRERLAATAEAYDAMPGVDLDLSDDESLRSSAEDALFTLTEGSLKVLAATNRALSVVGVSQSAESLRKTLEALSADMPKLCNVDVSGVRFGLVASAGGASGDENANAQRPRVSRRAAKRAASAAAMPVCGIMTTPYPCLITRDGRRYLEGAVMGDSVILEIGADSVVLTNATGRFTWKP